MEIYHSVAETLPDFRDETLDVETSLVAGNGDDKDPYSDLLAARQAHGPGNPTASPSKTKTPKLRKMRKPLGPWLFQMLVPYGIFLVSW